MKRGDGFSLAIGKLCWVRRPGRIGSWYKCTPDRTAKYTVYSVEHEPLEVVGTLSTY